MKSVSLEEKLWDNVDRGAYDECWEWTGACSDGYGKIWDGERNQSAHRVAYALEVEDPGDDWVLHHCDNRPCVNPDHLYLGDRNDNAADARDRSVWPSYNRGEDSGQAKLTEEEVREIRDRYENEDVYQAELADDYGVSQMNISRIVRGEYWSHV